MMFADRRANKRALKAANGPSLAPKGYETEPWGREMVTHAATEGRSARKAAAQGISRKKLFEHSAQTQDYWSNHECGEGCGH
jgi:hypothetical protein